MNKWQYLWECLLPSLLSPAMVMSALCISALTSDLFYSRITCFEINQQHLVIFSHWSSFSHFFSATKSCVWSPGSEWRECCMVTRYFTVSPNPLCDAGQLPGCLHLCKYTSKEIVTQHEKQIYDLMRLKWGNLPWGKATSIVEYSSTV